MTLDALLAFAGALLCSILAIGVVCRKPRKLVPWTFALGMLVLALREVFTGMEAQAVLPVEVMRWKRLGWTLTTLLPGSWLLFSLAFARINYRESVAKWWVWIMVSALALPLIVATFFPSVFITVTADVAGRTVAVMVLGRIGIVVCIFCLLAAVIILLNLEWTLTASKGTKRWQIKGIILGVGSIFAVYVYTMSQTLLFAASPLKYQIIDSLAVIVADVLIIVSLARHRLESVNISLSHTALYNSLTILLVGVYLLVVWVLAEIIGFWGGSQMLPLGALFAFLALVGLAIILLSEQLRQESKRFINRYVYRKRHDYRHAWITFNERTASVVGVKELCAVVARMVSEMLAVPSVTIWLWNEEAHGRMMLGASTVFSENQAHPPGLDAEAMAELVSYLRDRQMPVNFAASSDTGAKELMQLYPEGFRNARIRYAVLLMAGRQVLGVMTLHERLAGGPLKLEDENLLKIITDQTATILLNLRLTQHLMQAQQMQAFQTVSTFFVHDLKNLASKLSLTVKNLPVHWKNPAFREDALDVISESVSKINAMCGSLSRLTKKLELHCVETDLNDLVQATLADMRPSVTVPLIVDLHTVPRLTLDPEQLDKVLVNLVLNAQEAVDADGEICVATEQVNGWITLSVRDNGCGMSREFMDQSLFRPFQTTKSRGMGIGLFQSKRIVEAHQGRIEVESNVGEGSTFRVLLRC